MLEIRGLSKSYGKEKVLAEIDLNIEEDKIYGLLGRNGAGKTTLLKLISSQRIRDSGEIKLNGDEIFENQQLMAEFCLVGEFFSSIKEKKIKTIFSQLRLLYTNWDKEYEKFLIKEFNLNTNKKVSKLSTGNQTIVGLIIGLASRAKITMFDEPTIGLDANMRYKFYNQLLADYEKYPRTVIISTHAIDEVSNLFEEIIILNEQRVVLKKDVELVKQKSYFLWGREDAINQIIANKRIIHSEKFGSTKIVGIYGDFTLEEKEEIKEKNIEINSIPLQKLFVYLTNNIIEEVYEWK